MKIHVNGELEVPVNAIFTDLKIGTKKYTLEVEQTGFDGNGLQLHFRDKKTDGTFRIIIDERGLRLTREVLRPNHDHSDFEDMRIVDGKPQFFHGHVNDELKHELAWFEFGPTKVDW